MTAEQGQQAKFWDVDLAWETRDDGTMYVWQKGELPKFPDRLSDKIHHWAEAAPDRLWMAARGESGAWEGMTYAELLRNVRAIGQALLDLGLSQDRPLVILSANSIPHGLMALGAQYVGVPSAAIAPAYALVSTDYGKLKSVRDQITPGAVFAEGLDQFAPAIDAVFGDLPRLGVTGQGAAMSWEALLATTPTEAVDKANAATGPDTVAKFMFTSGTTGSPKAVIQTQRMLCGNMAQVLDCYAYFKDEPPVIVDWAPWNHVASGNKVFNMAIYNGGTFYIDDGRPTPKLIGETIRNVREVRPNWFFNVPAGYEMMVEEMNRDPGLRDAFFSNVKLLLYAGAAMAQHTWTELERLSREALGYRVTLSTGLGSTETAPFSLFCVEPQEAPGNIGVPAKGITLKLVPNEGKMEARVKGPNVTPGYWRNEMLTTEAFDDEGFYCFGDALRLADPEDPRKGFFFDGRVAENFKLGTGTWVAVGAMRAKLTDALGGLARDAVLVGEGHEELAALLIPFRPAMERLVEGGAALEDEALVAHPAVRAETARLLAAHVGASTGSSNRVRRVMYLTDPLDLDKGEVTDKGSVNQRAVLRHRADLAEVVYTDDPRVITA
ncbi:feruloyl-CoA synthase [Pseudoprimorskyibacter insulae]|uniref:Long-chain-fatty-acid--CoA ligase n=1 Tax=Pseudoprimorskyibacter insulae TaxID=1695997 RepID=A0A2R8AW20_9RHOB|nr:feruloyl-CoA synthase [Pseudoprimorskyibacter insulae]SPF80223.1 Long-chain-fatty-acid--CoA ligase [Pseudoprimorskyibacter insulae]